MGGHVGLADESFEDVEVGDEEVDGLSSGLFGLGDVFESGPDEFFERGLVYFFLFEEVDDDVDNACDEVVVLD